MRHAEDAPVMRKNSIGVMRPVHYYKDEMTYPDIAKALNITRAQVLYAYRSALRKLTKGKEMYIHKETTDITDEDIAKMQEKEYLYGDKYEVPEEITKAVCPFCGSLTDNESKGRHFDECNDNPINALDDSILYRTAKK